ncbi:ERF family protein [Methylorubrum extorquens]|uniref:ERF family protein n=1 Tax=Methylorubrum extorquens DSM 13060 TaxID=882800 RepID=H1KCA7_METEX|nr:ERF family protein [Methylorubrum extorquens]EHP94924.1 ERF family protein [Methylorubrum extorquens DSM 13060]
MGEIARTQDLAAPAAVSASENIAIISMIERAVRDPSVDIDKLERLMAMQERVAQRTAEMAFNAAMQAAQAEMPQVYRDAKNEQTRSRYARLESISAAIRPVITQHGFSLSYGTDTSPLKDHYRVTCVVAHAGGFSRTYFADIPTDANGMKGNQNKTATHAFGSTMSYGRRYLMLMVFDIALTNEDDDGQSAGGYGARRQMAPSNDVITDEQATQIRTLATEVGADIGRFLNYFRAESIPDIPAARYAEAVRLLEAKRGRQ